MARLKPDYLVPGHTLPIAGGENATIAVTDFSEAIRSVYDRTTEGISQGRSPDLMAHEVELPKHLRDKSYLVEFCGTVPHAARAIERRVVLDEAGSKKMITTARVAIPHGVACTRRLCKYFSHKIPAVADGNLGLCEINCDDEYIHIGVDLSDPGEVERAERVVGDHLVRMADKDNPVVSGQRKTN